MSQPTTRILVGSSSVLVRGCSALVCSSRVLVDGGCVLVSGRSASRRSGRTDIKA